jgi:hypothetical protein
MHKGFTGRGKVGDTSPASTFDRCPAMKTNSTDTSTADIYLRDYIVRKQDASSLAPDAKKKVTFETWWNQSREQLMFGDRRKEYFQECWKAAQENK